MALRWHSDSIHQRRIRFIARVAPPAVALVGTAYAAETVFPRDAVEGLVLAGLFWTTAAAALVARRLAPPVVRVEGADPSARLVDEESGLGNGLYFREAMRRELARGARHRSSAAVVLIETRVRGFLPASDDEEPPTGARFAATVLLRTMRQSDVAARLGARRFGVLLAETDLAGARAFAGRLTQEFGRHPMPWKQQTRPLQMTVTAGCAVATEEYGGVFDILRAAEQALKEAGAPRRPERAVPA